MNYKAFRKTFQSVSDSHQWFEGENFTYKRWMPYELNESQQRQSQWCPRNFLTGQDFYTAIINYTELYNVQHSDEQLGDLLIFTVIWMYNFETSVQNIFIPFKNTYWF